MKFFTNDFKVIEKSLNAYSTRANAIADNIANVNTPNYKRKDVQFENLLEEALEDSGSSLEGLSTNEKHFDISKKMKLEGLSAKLILENSTSMRNDGNNVDIEKEQAEFAKNNIRYQLATTRMSQKFNVLKSVIKGK